MWIWVRVNAAWQCWERFSCTLAYATIFVRIQAAEPLLPYALTFAAGAMVYVVIDDIIPESYSWYASKLSMATICTLLPLLSLGNYKITDHICIV